MVAKIPSQIMKELDIWVKESKKFKNSPLAALKAHENVGYLSSDGKKHNSYLLWYEPLIQFPEQNEMDKRICSLVLSLVHSPFSDPVL